MPRPESGMHDPSQPRKEPRKRRVLLLRGGKHDGHLAPGKILPHRRGETYLKWLQRTRRDSEAEQQRGRHQFMQLFYHQCPELCGFSLLQTAPKTVPELPTCAHMPAFLWGRSSRAVESPCHREDAFFNLTSPATWILRPQIPWLYPSNPCEMSSCQLQPSIAASWHLRSLAFVPAFSLLFKSSSNNEMGCPGPWQHPSTRPGDRHPGYSLRGLVKGEDASLPQDGASA